MDVGELVQRVRDHGGTLILSEALTALTTTRRAAYRRAIHQINQERLAGPGFVLRHRGRDHGDLAIRLGAIGDGQPDESTEQMWAPEEVQAARDLLAELRMSGNVLLLPDSTDLERYRLLMRVASTGNLLEPGESLKESRTYYGADRELGTELTLHRDFKPCITLVPVAVPERVTRFLPAVAWYRQEVDRQEVTKEHQPRALRVLDAIAREAARRGWELRPRLSDVSRHC